MLLTIVRGMRSGEAESTTYDLPDLKGASISNALQYINTYIDGTVAYYLSCRRGICACCVVKANGKPEMACVVPVTDGMVIEPALTELLVKDTVMDFSLARGAQCDLDEECDQ